jgi:hypothetical protein
MGGGGWGKGFNTPVQGTFWGCAGLETGNREHFDRLSAVAQKCSRDGKKLMKLPCA